MQEVINFSIIIHSNERLRMFQKSTYFSNIIHSNIYLDHILDILYHIKACELCISKGEMDCHDFVLPKVA